MRNSFISLMVIALCLCGCNNYSKYAIDEKPKVLIDSSLYGIWKVKEDTDKANYVLVQNFEDAHEHIIEQYGSVEKLANALTDPAMRSVYQKELERKKYTCYVTYFNHHGTNPYYQQFGMFASMVNGKVF